MYHHHQHHSSSSPSPGVAGNGAPTAADIQRAITAPLYFGPKSVKARVSRREPGESNMNASEKVQAMCAEFTYKSLRPIEPEIRDRCHSAITHNFVSPETRCYVETSAQRIHNFLRALDAAMTEGESLPMLVLPPKPKLDRLENPATWTDDEERRRRARLENIAKKKRELADEQARLRELERQIAEEKLAIDAQRQRILSELAKVKPALDMALEGLAAIKDEHLWEVRSYQTPPPMVHKVLSSVLTVLGTSKADDWSVIQSHMKRKDFIPSIRDFDVNSVDPARIKPLRRFIDDPSFTHENAVHASKAAAPLRVWVIALTEYTEVYARVRPLLEELERDREQRLRPMEEEAERVRGRVRGLEKEVADLETAFRRIFDEAELRERDADAQKIIDKRNSKRLAAWETKCRGIRERHQKRVDAILSKPPEIDEEARRVGAIVKKRCLEVLEAIDASFRRVKQPATGEPAVLVAAASPARVLEPPSNKSLSPRREAAARGRSATPIKFDPATGRAHSKEPWHTRLFPSSSPARYATPPPRQHHHQASQPSSRLNSPPRSPLRSPNTAAGASSFGGSPVPRDPSGSPARQRAGSSPLGPATPRPAPLGSPRRFARQDSHQSSASKGSATTTSTAPPRHPLARPEPGSKYRGTAVERYYLALNLKRSMAEAATAVGGAAASPSSSPVPRPGVSVARSPGTPMRTYAL